jgi:hypothetical protein
VATDQSTIFAAFSPTYFSTKQSTFTAAIKTTVKTTIETAFSTTDCKTFDAANF